LIVAEDVALAADLRRGFKDAGYRPVSVSDERGAVEAITHEKPALVLVVTTRPEDASSRFLAKVSRTPALARIPSVLLAIGGVVSGDSIRSGKSSDPANLDLSALMNLLMRPPSIGALARSRVQ
jgi:hypothetical protein